MPERHPNSARFHELLEAAGEMHDRKQADYGKDDDPFANVRASEEWGMPGWVGSMLRLNDKVRRLQAMLRNGRLENESAADSFMDIAVYALIAYVLYEQEQLECDYQATYCQGQDAAGICAGKYGDHCGRGCAGKDLGPDLVHRVGEYTPEVPDFDAEREGWE